MASRSVSPGGALLRASRVFSIPPPLPRPTIDLSSDSVRHSDTATLPHPIQLSITTPQSSLAKGDWGFKRPLPRRSTTRTSTPIIRVESIDTLERITEFASAADHSLTLQKWQEMAVPITVPPKAGHRRATDTKNMSLSFYPTDEVGQSVFEDKLDSTVQTERGLLDKDDTRWKFKGPWLAGLNEGEFHEYVRKHIRGKKLEFRQFLRSACAEDMTRQQRRLAMEGDGEMQEAVQAEDVTEGQLDAYIKNLRGEIQNLNRLIRKFLDLPPPPNRDIQEEIQNGLANAAGGAPLRVNHTDYTTSDSPYANTGPPKTHPSAGLSYSRSSSYLFNHPVYGPQKFQPPVKGRILRPKEGSVGSFGITLGVGGFAVNVPSGDTSFNLGGQVDKRGQRVAKVPGLLHVEVDKVGGSKVWLTPTSATIDPKGKVQLIVKAADEEAVAVKEEKTHEIPTRTQMIDRIQVHTTRLFPRKAAATDTLKGYGLADLFKRD